MTDIQKMIEEEANAHKAKVYQERIVLAKSYIDSVDIALAVKHGANFALSQLQHANRWRKVSEELPEWKGEPFTLLTKKIGEYGITYNIFPIHTEKSILFMKDLSDEWKPIE